MISVHKASYWCMLLGSQSIATAHFAEQPGLVLTIALLFYYFLHFNWKKDGLKHKGNMLWQVLIMAGHAMLKTCPSGLSDNKNLGLRPRLLSIWIPWTMFFNIAWPAIIKTYNKIELWPHNYLHQRDSIMRVIYQSSCFTVLFGLSQLHS